jgi:membrane protein YdbS with pleckstrin-like domain
MFKELLHDYRAIVRHWPAERKERMRKLLWWVELALLLLWATFQMLALVDFIKKPNVFNAVACIMYGLANLYQRFIWAYVNRHLFYDDDGTAV